MSHQGSREVWGVLCDEALMPIIWINNKVGLGIFTAVKRHYSVVFTSKTDKTVVPELMEVLIYKID